MVTSLVACAVSGGPCAHLPCLGAGESARGKIALTGVNASHTVTR